MTREYEVVYIFDGALAETEITERLDRFHGLLAGPETPTPVTSMNQWGKRTLAYPIKGREVGYYVVTRLETQPDQLAELERIVKLDEGVLRHLVVLNEGLAPAVEAQEDGAEQSDSGDEGGEG